MMFPLSNKGSTEQVFVLGGHRLSQSYVQKLLQARKNKVINFENISFIDPDPQCFLAQHPEGEVQFIKNTYADFLVEQLEESPNEKFKRNILIPDHTAPHVFFQVFIDLLRRNRPDLKVEIIPFQGQLNTPFQKTFDSGICAVSYATWICPLECDEPALCPHLNAERTWDFRQRFEAYRQAHESDFSLSLHYFFCDQLAYGVAYLPMQALKDEWKQLTQRLTKVSLPLHILVATFSKCHGILGLAQLEYKTS